VSLDCAYPSGDVTCGASSCEEGVALARVCDGAGRCDVKTESCGAYACGVVECLTSCTSEADCSTWADCVDGVCQGALEDGDDCSKASECASGFCVDGVCCESSCTDACKACNLPGSKGVCAPDPSETGCEGAAAPLWEGDVEEGGCGCRVAGGEPREGRASLLAGLALVASLAVRRRKGTSLDPRR